jgi:hypothetical protein
MPARPFPPRRPGAAWGSRGGTWKAGPVPAPDPPMIDESEEMLAVPRSILWAVAVQAKRFLQRSETGRHYGHLYEVDQENLERALQRLPDAFRHKLPAYLLEGD